MKKILLLLTGVICSLLLRAQETLQSVTDRGATTTNNIKVSNYIDAGYGNAFRIYDGSNFAGGLGSASWGFTGYSPSDLIVYGTNNLIVATGGVDQLRVTTAGNVGIGTSAPRSKLDVDGRIISTGYIDAGANTAFRLYDNVTFTGGLGANAWTGNMMPGSNDMAVYSTNGLGIFSNNVLGAYLHKNGNMGIGTVVPDAKLTVVGKIHSQEVKVTVNAGADFVFDNNYPLKPLNEVEQYITEHKHLPEIPSAANMIEEGLELGTMNLKLLQKIEELTLHLIDQNKKIKEQDERMQRQDEVVLRLMGEVSDLQRLITK